MCSPLSVFSSLVSVCILPVHHCQHFMLNFSSIINSLVQIYSKVVCSKQEWLVRITDSVARTAKLPVFQIAKKVSVYIFFPSIWDDSLLFCILLETSVTDKNGCYENTHYELTIETIFRTHL